MPHVREAVAVSIFGKLFGSGVSLDELQAALVPIRQRLEAIMASQQDQAATLRQVQAQLTKVAGEIAGVQSSVDMLNARIVELEAVIAADDEASQELVDAVQAVKDQAQLVDDAIPDAPVVP